MLLHSQKTTAFRQKCLNKFWRVIQQQFAFKNFVVLDAQEFSTDNLDNETTLQDARFLNCCGRYHVFGMLNESNGGESHAVDKIKVLENSLL